MPTQSTKSAPAVSSTGDESLNLLPDEDLASFQELKFRAMSDLAPVTYLESRIATNIVEIEWDIMRHRRLLSAAVRTAFVQHSEGVFETGIPRLGHSPFKGNEEKKSFLHDVKSDCEADRVRADKVLAERGVTRAEISAAAFAARHHQISYHETRIADLERRRRSLLADYDALRAKAKPKPILDADFVEAS